MWCYGSRLFRSKLFGDVLDLCEFFSELIIIEVGRIDPEVVLYPGFRLTDPVIYCADLGDRLLYFFCRMAVLQLIISAIFC